MKETDIKYIGEPLLSPDVFFRITRDGDVVLFQTSQQKVYLLDGEVADILKYFWERKKRGSIDLIKDNNQLVNDVRTVQIIDELKSVGILVQDTALLEENYSLETQIKLEKYGKSNELYAVMFELTYRCNERCKHCYCDHDDFKNELSFEEIKKVIDDLKAMNVVELTFTGGDIFVRQDAFDILEYAYKLGFVINVFTNGTLLNDSDFFRLKEIYPRCVHFSLYNYIPEKHDSFTQLPGSFEKTVTAIKKCKMLGIPVNIKMSVLDENVDDIEGMLKLAETLGVTVQVSLQIMPRNDGSMSNTVHRLDSPEAYARIMKKIENHVILLCANGEASPEQSKRENGPVCGAGGFALSINPFGEVFPCNTLLISCGNVRNMPIFEIWNKSEMLDKVRSFKMNQIKGCEGCELKRYCDFCPGSALLENGDPLKKYSGVCLIAEARKINEEGE